MPNFQDRVIQGSGTRGNVGDYIAESLPNIIGKTGNVLSTSNQAEGCFTDTTYITGINYDTSPSVYARTINFDASQSSSVYQNNVPVQQNALCLNIVIKY